MLITTSRKPSAKTKTLCKLLSRIAGGRCIQRGKMGMQELVESAEGGQLIVVGEYHGNPGELAFHDENGKLLFSVRFSESYSKDLESYWFPELEPVLTGKGEIAEALEEFFHFERVEEDKIEQLPVRSILIAVGEKEIDFKGDGKSLFKLNLRGFKRY